jgi:hypothetical protein
VQSTTPPRIYGSSRLTNKKIQDPRISWAVTAKTNDIDISTVPAPASVEPTLDCWATTNTRTTTINIMNDSTPSRALIALS